MTTFRDRAIRYGWLVLILFVALVARTVHLGLHSLLIDEAFVGLGARDIAYNHTPMWDAISNAPFVWMLAQLFNLVGHDSPLLLRLPSAISGVLSVATLYYLARRLFSERSGLIAAAVFAIHPFAIAFQRIAFVDSHQLLFLLLGFLAFDRYMATASTLRKTFSFELIVMALLWAIAFILKYNAALLLIVWATAGVVAGRYRFKPAGMGVLVAGLACVLTFALWPYDAPVWFFAFLQKGGSYNQLFGFAFFWGNAAFLFCSLLYPTLALLAVILIRNREHRPERAMLLICVVLYLAAEGMIGRLFLRYLLIMIPFMAMITSELLVHALDIIFQRRITTITVRATVIGCTVFLLGYGGREFYRDFGAYAAYLRNDINLEEMAREVRSREGESTRGFWLMHECIAGYYLGFSQYYSRDERKGLDGMKAELNYFDWLPVPFGSDTLGNNVDVVRKALRQRGLTESLGSINALLADIRIGQERNSKQRMVRSSLDYLVDTTTVRQGDMLLLYDGFTSSNGEPIVWPIENGYFPPYLPRLPLEKFDVVKVYRPEGASEIVDTVLSPLRAGGWILRRK